MVEVGNIYCSGFGRGQVWLGFVWLMVDHCTGLGVHGLESVLGSEVGGYMALLVL